MKKFSIFFLVILLISCTMPNNVIDKIHDEIQDEINITKYTTHIYYGDFSEIEIINDIMPWIKHRVTYKSDNYPNSVQSSKETLTLHTGNCEDFSILYMNILYVRFGIKSELILVEFDDIVIRTIENGNDCDHAIVRLPNGTIVEPQNGIYYYTDVQYSYKFDDIFY